MISVYAQQIDNEINIRKLETFERYNQLIQWGRANPTRFIEKVFKIELLDYQKWVILNTWTAEKAAWVCSRNSGKSFLGAIYMSARALLFPNLKINIMSVTGRQSFDTFKKLEDIAKKNITSLLNTSDVFFDELVKSNANTDGFIHNQKGYECALYNGSTIKALVGNPKTIVGQRSHLNFYDEAGKIPEDFFNLTEPFTAQNTGFKTGEGFDAAIHPRELPTQCIYASSAEDKDSHLYKMYKMCAMKMMMGIPGYFAADISCDLPLHPKINGKDTVPLLKQTEVDDAMKENETRALREYYNIFDDNGGSDAVVKRQDILRNEVDVLPVFSSVGKDHHYGIFFDPALQQDNSFCLIADFIHDEKKGWYCQLVNGINLIEKLPNGDKKPLRSPEQLEWIRKLVIAYNGIAPEYENLDLYIDAGAGGGGRSAYGDNLLLDWEDRDGNCHRGLIDLNDAMQKLQAEKFPKAVDKMHLLEPSKYKTQIYSDLGDMVTQDLIKFTPAVPRGGVLKRDDGTEQELTTEELRALLEIDLLKEEAVAMIKKKTQAGNIIYTLPPDKARKMHDDRAYTLAMCAYHLAELRRSEALQGNAASMNMDVLFTAYSNFGRGSSEKKSSIPFANVDNPFRRR